MDYAVEMYDLCDREGIVVIDEVPAVGINAGGAQNPYEAMRVKGYQPDYYSRINAELDKRPFFIGEQVWNFAGFATIQGSMRVDGNKKGLLTRDRRPKLAAHYFRRRWHGIPDFGYKP